MLDTDIENNLALAGVCQAAALVQQLARRGSKKIKKTRDKRKEKEKIKKVEIK